MPYLRITCPEIDASQRPVIARALTEAVVELFFDRRARMTRDELRDRTTVHFMPYADAELFVGGRTPRERGTPDVTVELSDWSMSVGKQRRVARALTPLVAKLFRVPADEIDNVNFRFRSYPPTDFAVGGTLLIDRVPRIGRFMKRFAS
ncbi:MAG: hypothetical protein JO165_00135 [Candidatus Eremiobacteraeota bacterium]|nr:hypothetical protein [Candidatus Eremiobacteraeota bacterium]